MTKTIICTVAVGEHKLEDVNRLVKTFTEYSDCDIVVYTDCVDGVEHDNVIDITGVTSCFLHRGVIFNYNLKGIITGYTYDRFTEYDRIIWMDCDLFLTGRCIPLDDMNESDIYGRLERFPLNHIQQYDKHLLLMQEFNMDWGDIYDDLWYWIETILIVNRNERSEKFLHIWKELCERISNETKINPCYECVEFALSLFQCDDLIVGKIPRYIRRPDVPVITLHTMLRGKPFDLF